MNKKVLILSGSPRNRGNSDLLCDEFMRGALDSGSGVEKIRVAEKRVAPCLGCCYCAQNGDRKDGKRFSSYASDSDIADWIS